MNHTCLCLPSRCWHSFTDPGGMEGWVGLGLVTYWNRCPAPGIEPDTVAHLSTQYSSFIHTMKLDSSVILSWPWLPWLQWRGCLFGWVGPCSSGINGVFRTSTDSIQSVLVERLLFSRLCATFMLYYINTFQPYDATYCMFDYCLGVGLLTV